MGVGSEGQGAVPPWIFMHDTDKVEGGLIMAVAEQNSFVDGKNLPEFSKQSIFKCIVCSPKNVFTKISPFFHVGLM